MLGVRAIERFVRVVLVHLTSRYRERLDYAPFYGLAFESSVSILLLEAVCTRSY